MRNLESRRLSRLRRRPHAPAAPLAAAALTALLLAGSCSQGTDPGAEASLQVALEFGPAYGGAPSAEGTTLRAGSDGATLPDGAPALPDSSRITILVFFAAAPDTAPSVAEVFLVGPNVSRFRGRIDGLPPGETVDVQVLVEGPAPEGLGWEPLFEGSREGISLSAQAGSAVSVRLFPSPFAFPSFILGVDGGGVRRGLSSDGISVVVPVFLSTSQPMDNISFELDFDEKIMYPDTAFLNAALDSNIYVGFRDQVFIDQSDTNLVYFASVFTGEISDQIPPFLDAPLLEILFTSQVPGTAVPVKLRFQNVSGGSSKLTFFTPYLIEPTFFFPPPPP
jgi:hypothetical protein